VFANSESVKTQSEASNVRQANVMEEENLEEQIQKESEETILKFPEFLMGEKLRMQGKK